MPNPIAAASVNFASTATAAAAAASSVPTPPAVSTARTADSPACTLFVAFTRIIGVAMVEPAVKTTTPGAVTKDNPKGADAPAGTARAAAAGLLFVLRQELAEDLHLTVCMREGGEIVSGWVGGWMFPRGDVH